MNYKKIYNQLDRSGRIEKILVATNFDKIGIIKGIQYLEYFLGSSTFKDMKYWSESKDQTLKLVCKEYAELQIELKDKHIKKFEYLRDVM